MENADTGQIMKSPVTLLLFFVATLGALTAGIASAEDTNRTMTISSVYGPVFPHSLWTPLRLDFKNSTGKDVNGFGVLPLGNGTRADYTRPVYVPAHSRVRVRAMAYFPLKAPGDVDWSKAPPGAALTTARWEDTTGARIARVPLLGRPAAQMFKDLGDSDAPGFYLLGVSDDAEADDAFDTSDLAETLRSVSGVPVISPAIGSPDMGRTYGDYAAVKIIIMQDVDPDALGPAQRKALFDFINRGGNLILAAPREKDHVADSWLAPYLPAQPIGERLADRITPTGQTPFYFGRYLREAEAIVKDDGVTVILQDKDYVYAAYRQVGMGRVIFTSFPASALSNSDPRTTGVWRRLVSLAPSATAWRDTDFQTSQVDLLQSMLGRSTVSWTAAASVAGGFVLLVLLAQLLIGGARRPMAFAVSMAISIVVSIALVALTVGKTRAQNLSGARLSVMQVSATGSGEQREITAYVGRNDANYSLTAADGALVRPIVAGAEVPLIQEHPFSVPNAGVKALSIERVWETVGALPSRRPAEITARFEADGLILSTKNQLDQPLVAPLLRWRHAKFSLADLPVGDSRQHPDRRNGRDDFTNAAVIRSQTAQLRGDVLRALSTSSKVELGGSLHPTPPVREIDAWLDDGAGLLTPSQATPMRSQSLVRLPVRLESSPVGSTIKIDPAFARIVTGPARVPQYDGEHDQWLSTNLDTEMLVGFAAPREIGQLRPREVTIDLDIAAPQQMITIRRGQVRNGRLPSRSNPAGDVVGEWSQPVGGRTAKFTATAQDYDAQGRLWLLVTVHSSGVPVGSLVSQWSVRHLEVGFTAEVIGPPREESDAADRNGMLSGHADEQSQPAIPHPADKPSHTKRTHITAEVSNAR